MARIRVLSPVGVVARQSVAVPPLPRDLAGRTVGFLDNTKSNFDRLAAGLGELLRERYGVKAVLHRRKANAATPAVTNCALIMCRHRSRKNSGSLLFPARSRPCARILHVSFSAP